MNTPKIRFTQISSRKLILSDEFKATFPKLSELLNRSTTLEFNLNSNNRYRQIIWTLQDRKTCGWLCQLEHVIPQELNLISEHILLAKTIGGIIGYWGADDACTFLHAKNYTFSLQFSSNGFDWEDNYLKSCQEEGVSPIICSRLLTFSQEANGDNIFYNQDTKEVFLFAHDGYSPFDITLVEGQPEYSIYTYDRVKTFIDYVEALANQWEALLI